MEFRILGPVEVAADGRTIAIASRRQRALLALLVVHANEPMSVDRILDLLWGEEPPASGAKAVAFHVAELRRVLAGNGRGEDGSGPLRTVPGGYVLRADPNAIDAIRAERLGREAESLLTSDPAAALERLEEALGLWRGDPMSDLADESFARPEITHLDELRLHLLELHYEADLAIGRHAEIVGALHDLVAANPYRERLRGQLMLALYRSGRQAEALRAAQDGRRILAEELGIDPSPELQDLERAILRQDGALHEAGTSGPVRNPFKGLRPFDEHDAADFFGREALIDRLLQRLADVARGDGLLTLVGPSGSGKSSVVRAGLVPAVRRGALPGSDGWNIAMMEPGSHPFEELAAALGRAGAGAVAATDLRRAGLEPIVAALRPGARLLLVIDQFEDLYWRVRDDGLRDDFLGVLGALAAQPGRALAVITLRSDALDRALSTPDIAEAVGAGVEVVGRLTRDELARAITRPAESVGVVLEPGLLERIVADVADRPGTLPLLQYALTELYDRGDGRRLTLDGYEALGGVMGAVGRRAESVHAQLDPGGRRAARQLLLRLVDVHEGAAPTARRVTRDELRSLDVPTDTLETVVATFGRARLLSFDRDPVRGEPTVEPAHEALLSSWSRLAGWITDAREGLWMRSRLGDAAAEWDRAGRDPAFLLAGRRLALFADWHAGTTLGLSAIEEAYLEESRAQDVRAAEAEAARRAEERRLERRAGRWLRASAGLFGAVAVLAMAFAALVLSQGERAREQQAIAVSRELAAASLGSMGTDPELSLLLAREAVEATADRGYLTEEALDALNWSFQATRTGYPATDATTAVRPTPDGPRGVYLLPADRMLQAAMRGMSRRLTSEECRTYLHRQDCPARTIGGERSLLVYGAGGTIAMERLATEGLAGTRVRMAVELPPGVRLDLGAFEEATGIQVEIVSLDEPFDEAGPAVATADLLVTARSGLIRELARGGQVVELSSIIDVDALRNRLGTRLVDPWAADLDPQGASRPAPYGAPLLGSVSGLIWYPRDAFRAAGYEVPTSWPELETLSARMVGDGRSPWCLGLKQDAASGLSGADWVEDLVLADAGPATFTSWSQGVLPFGSTPVETAMRRFGTIAMAEDSVLGGPSSALRIPASIAGLPLFSGSQRCWLLNGSSTARAAWPALASAGLDVFPLPAIHPGRSDSIRGRVFGLVVRRDGPEVRAVVDHLLGDGYAHEAMRLLGPAGLYPLREVHPTIVEAGPARSSAERLAWGLAHDAFYPDASDAMPPVVGSGAFPNGVLDYVRWGSQFADLKDTLTGIDRAWPGRTP